MTLIKCSFSSEIKYKSVVIVVKCQVLIVKVVNKMTILYFDFEIRRRRYFPWVFQYYNNRLHFIAVFYYYFIHPILKRLSFSTAFK